VPEPHQTADYHLIPLTADHARQILRWRYQPPYDFYNSPDTGVIEQQYIEQFLDPTYAFHAIIDGQKLLAGFCSFGMDGQVHGGDYTDPALDIGLGMRPDLTGQGQGVAFFTSILTFRQSHFYATRLRLTVAQFNRRALALYKQFGFQETTEFTDPMHAIAYTVLNLDVTTRC
jgi:ribosomal-protein-alanine N-acetyltransferase